MHHCFEWYGVIVMRCNLLRLENARNQEAICIEVPKKKF